MFNKFKNKTIIITGHTGFKGSWLTLWLKLLGAKIIGISHNLPSKPSHFQKLRLKNKIIDIKIDIRNLKKLKKIFKIYQPDFVFHLAAQSLVKKSYINPVDTITTNTIGTMNVLESLKQINKKFAAVIITSDKSYKNLEIKRGYHENDLLGGKDPYSASKGAAEILIQSFISSYFEKNNKSNIGIARAGNVIGGGDWSEDRLIPDCVKSWSANKKVIIRNPKSTRPWQHVLEAIRGYLTLAEFLYKNPKLHGEPFNFGPNHKQNKDVITLVKEMKKYWKSISWSEKKDYYEPYESKLLKLDSSKAKKKLKWVPILSFEDTIKQTTIWYKSFYDKKNNIYELSKKQIKDYIKKIKKN
jgi:CDP-glucose 4,6-dehydratase